MCRRCGILVGNHPEGGRHRDRNVLVTTLWIKYIITIEVHLFAIYRLPIWLKHGRWKTLEPLVYVQALRLNFNTPQNRHAMRTANCQFVFNVLVHGTFWNVRGELCKTGNFTAFEPEATKFVRHSTGRNFFKIMSHNPHLLVVYPVLTIEEMTTKPQRYNCFIRSGGNAIPKHAGPEAKGSNPTTGLTLLWARNPFRWNFNHWQVSRK